MASQLANRLNRDIARCEKLVVKQAEEAEGVLASAKKAQVKNAKHWAKESEEFRQSREHCLERLRLLVEAEKLCALEAELNRGSTRKEAQIRERREEQKRMLSAAGHASASTGASPLLRGMGDRSAFYYNASLKLINQKSTWHEFISAVETRQAEEAGAGPHPSTVYRADPRLMEAMDEDDLRLARQDALYTALNLG